MYSDKSFRSAFEDTNVAMVLTDLNHRFVRVNAAFSNLFGYSQDEILRLSMEQITHPDDIPESYALRETLLAGRQPFFQMEKRYIHHDGHVVWGLTNVSLVRDGAGRPVRYVGQVQDITLRKQLEEQLRQAQKMEAIGRVAGGVAHDFNNLLTVMNGYSDMALENLAEGDPARELIGEIRKAGDRAAALTRQLLAFSRRQILAPVALNLNALLESMQTMLKRLAGEHVALSLLPAHGLWLARVDHSQMEQVVMNLVVNARDAMPHGGKLTMETANVTLNGERAAIVGQVRAGDYVLLTVADAGCGMDTATLARIFEPFFSTKGELGTGLGLATVYGIVKQSGGHVEAVSKPGRGTTFRVYLPRDPARGGCDAPSFGAVSGAI